MKGTTHGKRYWQRIARRLPKLLECLTNRPAYPFEKLTEACLKAYLGGNEEAKGVYVVSRVCGGSPVYVGRSKNLLRRLSSDHRSTAENKAPVVYAILRDERIALCSRTPKAALAYFKGNYQVRFLQEEDPNTRAALEIYAAINLNTIGKYNRFEEH